MTLREARESALRVMRETEERLTEERRREHMSDEILPLDDAAVEMLAEIDLMGRALMERQQTVLNYFAKQHNLGPGWRLAENRKELVKNNGKSE